MVDAADNMNSVDLIENDKYGPVIDEHFARGRNMIYKSKPN